MSEIHIALQEIQSGNTDKGLEILQRQLVKAGDEEKYEIAQMYQQLGLLHEANDVFQQLMETYPDESELKLHIAEIYTDLDDDEKALEYLNEIDEEDENYLHALVQAADLYQAQGLYEVAEQKLLQAKRLAPSEPVLDFALGELAYSTGEYQKAIPYYEKALKQQNTYGEIEVQQRLAECLASIGHLTEAMDYFQKVEKKSPDDMFRYGFTAFQGNRMDIAIHVWEKLLDKDSSYYSVYPLLTKAYEEEGLPDKAYDTVRKGLNQDEYNKEMYFLAGKIANKLGNREEAIEYVREAISLDPGYKEAIMFLVESFKEHEEYEKITDLLTNVLDLGETDPVYYWELARANYELEEYDKALNNYEEAYNGFTNDIEFLKEYGYILVEEGRLAKAKEVFQRYLAIEPSDTEMEEYVQRLER
ncbi:tetratricopeptide repeat protein [Salirhabdus salicampi]|uniref:tetratricopeptide repeat protein n=1 Tax=Salirhabdus salicampi TaxID=476102 RepID=UPI0020C45445|nr:tetratricopeptide repeat protein [Salirhabdus salicampi]MCP8616692.1 tetratricopeptide repeat protein [Salirhabdus salicampi]